MSKTITFPNCRSHFFIYVNGKLQTYTAGATVEVDDSIADIIQNHIDLQPKEDPNAGKSKVAQVMDRTITELTEADLKGVTKIGGGVLEYCDKLTVLEIPDTVTEIGMYAISNCNGLKSITIGEGLKSIAQWAFYYCENLESITLKAKTPPTITGASFYDCNKLSKFIVPVGSLEAYKSANNWSKYADKFVEGE